MIRYASVCDGISAVSVAWRDLGWKCAWVSEIDPFACAVLADRWPDHPNVGDMLAIDERIRDRGPIDLLVGGTPCQSFSVAGLRGGLDDPRGNLALRFVQLAGTLRPRWVIWENVPGVLSSNRGRDFGAIVGALEHCGYGIAWRILDAQFYGVPQRRRRVFIVGHLGDWRRSAAVLFDATSLRGDSPTRGKTRKGVALCPTLRAGGNSTGGHRPPGTDVDTVESLQVVAGTVTAGLGRSRGAGTAPESLIAGTVSAKWAKGTGGPSGDECQNLVAYRTAGDGAVYEEGDRCAPLTTNTDQNTNIVAFQSSQSGIRTALTHATLDANNGSRRHNGIARGLSVRRLTPRECERLQGFPDDYTLITYRGKPAADGPRYKAIGNSMAVPVMRWIGERIAFVDRIGKAVAS